jgi:hypothetical protein
MADQRPVSMVTIIALALTAGAAVGLLVGRLWAHEMEAFVALASTVQRGHSPEQWGRDSAARERVFRAFPRESPPRELRREEVVTPEVPCSGGRAPMPTWASAQATA